MFEVPAGELTPEFFVAVQQQLSVLVGSPKPKAPEVGPDAAGPSPEEPAADPAPATAIPS
jgi:hypothetical protein